MRILLFTARFGYGGAERQTTLLATRLAGRGHEVTACAQFAGGVHWRELGAAGLPRVALYRDRGGSAPVTLARLASAPRRFGGIVRDVAPDVVYSVLELPNLIAGLAGLRCPLVWGLRNSGPVGWKVRTIDRWSAALSQRVPLVICNSHAGRDAATERGYRPARWAVVPNGFDTDAFRPDRAAGAALRSRWAPAPGGPLVGLVGRHDVRKGHADFLAAAAAAARDLTDVRFVVVGGGSRAAMDSLRATAERLGLGGRVTWAGEQNDMNAVYGALDLLVSASTSEGLSNVLGEALACGVPCIATDVGDSARLVEDPARIVPPGDPAALAAAMVAHFADPPDLPDGTLRASIAVRYGVGAVVAATEEALAGLVAGERGAGS
jgi:glycosyltransferase involved in cell wall biosynthesis